MKKSVLPESGSNAPFQARLHPSLL